MISNRQMLDDEVGDKMNPKKIAIMKSKRELLQRLAKEHEAEEEYDKEALKVAESQARDVKMLIRRRQDLEADEIM